jgi:hypothetical protein
MPTLKSLRAGGILSHASRLPKGRTMRRRIAVLLLLGATTFGTVACTSPDSNPTTPPADHTFSMSGVYHKAGFTDPLNSCVVCHGTDLTGGTAGVSCFQCHGQKW